MKNKILVFLFSFLMIEAGVAVAQQPATAQKRFTKADSAAINALVLYPDTIRLDIFEACKYPELIVRIANEQKNISSDFANLISSYSKKEQEDLWDMSRYPDLVSKLVAGGKKSPDQINAIVSGYPDDIHETAVKYGKDYYDILKKMDDLQSSTNDAFEQLIADYSPVTQQAYRQIVQFPEVLSILNDHLDVAVLAGDRYKRDPQGVIRRADSLNLVITRQNAQDAQEWKDSIQQNPDAANDLKSAANDYAQEEGYTADEVQGSANGTVVSNYTCNPYPYWFGYPTWYPYSYWYPYPFWFDCGFYYDAYGNIVFIGMPSYNFMNWYFYYPEHWQRYPHLGIVYVNHYYGPRRAMTGNSVIVHKWVHDNKKYLPQDFLTNKSRNVQAIKELGQFRVDAQKQKTVAERDQYLQNNKEKYPTLNASPQQKMEEPARLNRDQQIRVPDVIQPPVKQPPVRLPKPVQQQQGQAPAAKPSPSHDYNYQNINRAQDYHRSGWEQAPPVRSQPAPQQHFEQPSRPSAPAPSRGGAPGRR